MIPWLPSVLELGVGPRHRYVVARSQLSDIGEITFSIREKSDKGTGMLLGISRTAVG
jgi:hypothetical protein